LTERQKEFKVEALKAKKANDLDEARKWLRMAKVHSDTLMYYFSLPFIFCIFTSFTYIT